MIRLSSATQYAMLRKYGNKWETECLNTRFLPTMLTTTYSVKLIQRYSVMIVDVMVVVSYWLFLSTLLMDGFQPRYKRVYLIYFLRSWKCDKDLFIPFIHTNFQISRSLASPHPRSKWTSPPPSVIPNHTLSMASLTLDVWNINYFKLRIIRVTRENFVQVTPNSAYCNCTCASLTRACLHNHHNYLLI